MLKMCKVISNSDIKSPAHQRQLLSSVLTPLPPPRSHPLLPSSALANAHMWANPGQACRLQQFTTHHHGPPLCSSTYAACPSNHIEDNDNESGWLKECEESG